MFLFFLQFPCDSPVLCEWRCSAHWIKMETDERCSSRQRNFYITGQPPQIRLGFHFHRLFLMSQWECGYISMICLGLVRAPSCRILDKILSISTVLLCNISTPQPWGHPLKHKPKTLHPSSAIWPASACWFLFLSAQPPPLPRETRVVAMANSIHSQHPIWDFLF